MAQLMGDFSAIWDPAALGNYDTSRLPVDLILLHHTACELSAAEARFQTPGALVSAHFIVAQSGVVYETVAIGDTAYHSGSYAINERSIGIEHESGPVGQDFFTEVQYQASAQLCMHIAEYFGFPLDLAHVWPHSQVVQTACPGVLDINRILAGGDMALDPNDPQVIAMKQALTEIREAVRGPDPGGILGAPDKNERLALPLIEQILAELRLDRAAIDLEIAALKGSPTVAGDPSLLNAVLNIEKALKASGAALGNA